MEMFYAGKRLILILTTVTLMFDISILVVYIFPLSAMPDITIILG